MEFFKAFNKVLEIISKVFLFLIIVLVFFAALVRWVGFPVAWSIDVAQILFGWVVFLGADQTLRKNGHIGIESLVEKFPAKVQKALTIVNYVLILAFLIIMVVFGIYLCVINVERLFNTIQISYSFATASVPFGCFLMSITVVRKLVSLFKGESPKKVMV